MDSKLEQRVCVKFGFKSGYTVMIRLNYYKKHMVVNVCCVQRVFKWFDQFRKSRVSIDNDPREWKLRTSRTTEKVEAVHAALVQNQHFMIGMLAEYFHIDKETMHMILTAYLGKKGVCAFHSARVEGRTARGGCDFFSRS